MHVSRVSERIKRLLCFRSWLLTWRWPLLENLCSMSWYEVSVMKRGTTKLKKAMMKRKLMMFLWVMGRETEVNSRMPAAQDTSSPGPLTSVLDSERCHAVLDRHSEELLLYPAELSSVVRSRRSSWSLLLGTRSWDEKRISSSSNAQPCCLVC